MFLSYLVNTVITVFRQSRYDSLMCAGNENHWFAQKFAVPLQFHTVIQCSKSVWMNGAVLFKTKKTPSHLPQLTTWQMIKHDRDACMSYCLPSVMTNITSMQRSMKDDRLGYLNLHRISKVHCSLPPLKMFSLNLPSWWMLHVVSPHSPHPCWPVWLMA